MRKRPHSLLLSIKWVDQGVVYPIRLSGLFSYPAWLDQEQRCPESRFYCIVTAATTYMYIVQGASNNNAHVGKAMKGNE